MIISNSKNFVFIHLEKTGGTSIEFALEPTLPSEDIVIGATPRGEESEGKYDYLWKHSSAQDIKSYMGDKWDSMYKFATVRDPAEIMISLYYYSRDIVSKSTEMTRGAVMSFFEIIDTTPWKTDMPFIIDFYDCVVNKTYLNGFIQALTTGQSHFILQTQTSRLDKSVEKFNIKNINEHWPTIQEKVGVSNISLGHLNKTNRPNDIFLKPESIEAIQTFFKEDYETLSILV